MRLDTINCCCSKMDRCWPRVLCRWIGSMGIMYTVLCLNRRANKIEGKEVMLISLAKVGSNFGARAPTTLGDDFFCNLPRKKNI